MSLESDRAVKAMHPLFRPDATLNPDCQTVQAAAHEITKWRERQVERELRQRGCVVFREGYRNSNTSTTTTSTSPTPPPKYGPPANPDERQP